MSLITINVQENIEEFRSKMQNLIDKKVEQKLAEVTAITNGLQN